MTERSAPVQPADRAEAAAPPPATTSESAATPPRGKRAPKRKAPRGGVRNGLMLLAISLVSFALGLGLNLQVGLPAWLAAFTALGAYVALISLQILIQRTRAIEQLDVEVRALRLEIEHLQALAAGGPHAAADRAKRRVAGAAAASRPAASPRRRAAHADHAGCRRADGAVAVDGCGSADGDCYGPSRAGFVIQPPALYAAPSLPALASVPLPQSPAQSPPWAFRPDAREAVHAAASAPVRRAEPQLPPLSHEARHIEHRRATEPVADTADPFAFRPAATTPPKRSDEAGRPWHKLSTSAAVPAAPVIAATTPDEDSVARIQDLIKKLADDVNGGEVAEHRPVASTRMSMRQAAQRRAELDLADDRVADTAKAALDTASLAMREVAKPQPQFSSMPALEDRRPVAPPIAVQAPVAAPPRQQSSHIIDEVAAPVQPSAPVAESLSGIARDVADAISAERIDVMLDPIQSLGDRRARHYELFMRLRDAQGRTMEPADMLAVARDAGLLGRLEALKLQRTARFASILREKGRQGSVISSVAGDVLGDDQFLDGVADTLGDGDQTTVVLAFDQADVRAFGPIHWETLGVMTTLGVSFMLTEVVDLDMDFQKLTETGFKFAKLDAEVFLEGLPMEDGILPSGDVCSHLADAGLDLIVGGIGSEWTLTRVAGYGVAYGQGGLFGTPKPVKAEMLAPTRNAA